MTEQEELIICSASGQQIARHRLLSGKRERSLLQEHYQGLTIPATPAVRGRPVAVQEPAASDCAHPFWEAPQVEVRPLSIYDQLIGGF